MKLNKIAEVMIMLQMTQYISKHLGMSDVAQLTFKLADSTNNVYATITIPMGEDGSYDADVCITDQPVKEAEKLHNKYGDNVKWVLEAPYVYVYDDNGFVTGFINATVFRCNNDRYESWLNIICKSVFAC